MPETNIGDDIDRVRDRVWNNALKVCALEHYYTGTFCFPLGPEFGCGSAINMAMSELAVVMSCQRRPAFLMGEVNYVAL